MLSGSLNAATAFFQTNLASDIPFMAANFDPNLKNPWGMSFSPAARFGFRTRGQTTPLYTTARCSTGIVRIHTAGSYGSGLQFHAVIPAANRVLR
jgi:hypothetical protein